MSDTNPTPAPKRAARAPDPTPEPAAPKRPPVLVANTTRGVRTTCASEPSDIDASGMQRHTLTKLHLFPGLSLVDADAWDKVRPGVLHLIADGTIRELPGGLSDLPKPLAIEAIKLTGHADVLAKLEPPNDEIANAIAKQVRIVTSQPARHLASTIQHAHSRET